MAVQAPRLQAAIDGKNYTLHPNPREPRTPLKRTIDLTDTAAFGPFRMGQFGDRFFKLLNTIRPNENFSNLSTMFNKMWTVTIIPRLLGVTKGAKDAVDAVKNLKPGDDRETTRRRYITAVNDVTDAASAWGYASSLILACFKKTAELSLPVLKAADTITFVHDVADLQINAQDFNRARVAIIKADRIEGGGTELKEVRNNLVETQRFHMLKIFKAVCSVAGFIFSIVLAAMGQVIPAAITAAASISLFSTIFAMGASIQEESMKYQRIKFFDDRHVQRQPQVAVG